MKYAELTNKAKETAIQQITDYPRFGVILVADMKCSIDNLIRKTFDNMLNDITGNFLHTEIEDLISIIYWTTSKQDFAKEVYNLIDKDIIKRVFLDMYGKNDIDKVRIYTNDKVVLTDEQNAIVKRFNKDLFAWFIKRVVFFSREMQEVVNHYVSDNYKIHTADCYGFDFDENGILKSTKY